MEPLKGLEETIREHRPEMVLNLLPPFWQLEPRYAEASHSCGLPALSCSPKNLPLAREMVRQTGADGVVIAKELVPTFKQLLDEANVSMKFWYVLSEENDDIPELRGETVEREMFNSFPV